MEVFTWLNSLAEYIMALFLISPAPITALSIVFLDPYGLSNVSISGVPVHSNFSQYIVYEISNHRLLQHWVGCKINHMESWEGIDLTLFEQAQNTTTFHM